MVLNLLQIQFAKSLPIPHKPQHAGAVEETGEESVLGLLGGGIEKIGRLVAHWAGLFEFVDWQRLSRCPSRGSRVEGRGLRSAFALRDYGVMKWRLTGGRLLRSCNG
jgi:hypothetical protein